MSVQDERTLLEQQLMREENCASTYTRYASITRDPELARLYEGFAHEAHAHAGLIRSLLQGQGIGEDNVLQNRATSAYIPSGGSTGDEPATDNVPPVRGRDEDMVDDTLLTLKSMSEAYRAALRQTADEGVCAALIGMRRDEDSQKERLARYLHQHHS